MKKIIFIFLLSIANITHGMEMNDNKDVKISSNVKISFADFQKFYLVSRSDVHLGNFKISDITHNQDYINDRNWFARTELPKFKVNNFEIFILCAKAENENLSDTVEYHLNDIKEVIIKAEQEKAEQNKQDLKEIKQCIENVMLVYREKKIKQQQDNQKDDEYVFCDDAKNNNGSI